MIRGIANALIFGSVAVLLYGIAHYVVHLPNLLPIRSVVLLDMPVKVASGEVLAMTRREVRGNFLTVNIDSLRRSLETLPWVRKVSIRREFPGRLAVQIEEHHALAHWNDDALVNSFGEVFVAETTEPLPEFVGVKGSTAEMAQQYENFGKQLDGLHLRVDKLELSPRHAWQMRLNNNWVLELGREDMQQRLARFVLVYPYGISPDQPAGQGVDQERLVVDMRYHHGFAVRRQHA